VVHHYADDHMNSYVRFKLALTEDAPAIKDTRKACGRNWTTLVLACGTFSPIAGGPA